MSKETLEEKMKRIDEVARAAMMGVLAADVEDTLTTEGLVSCAYDTALAMERARNRVLRILEDDQAGDASIQVEDL